VVVYDVLDRKIMSVYSGFATAGRKERIDVDFIDYPAGTYYYRITGDDFSVTEPMVLAR